ncbi:MAG: hypothetical protein HMLKMBBP_01294 [Planctomycetes bacterium]|nr:hypothetical protein [Planctomycetota bacterium]
MREVFGGARAVTFPVRSVARSRRFWVERMGFRLMQERAGHQAVVNLGTLRLILEAAPEGRAVGGASIVFQTRNLARTAKELAEKGIAFEHHTGPRKGDWIEAGDPDGNSIVFAERIVSERA